MAKNFSSWLDFLVLLVISISTVSVTLFMIDLFVPKQAVFLGLALGTTLFYVMKKKSILVADVESVGFLPILALLFFAAVFRIEPYPWINGGQDQGVYVSMSSYYQNGGNNFIEDPVLQEIVDPELKDIYQESLPKEFFQPGVYYGGQADYVFQFYHLHPLWMAIFADFFGDGARVYSLTFFSLLSIIFLSLLTFELSSSKRAAYSVGFLLAVNPLHAFFSKWPVTEIIALSFSAIAFYYLARACRLSELSSHAGWALFVACSSMTMFFFVRITGFLYLPLLFFVFVAGTWFFQVRAVRFGKHLVTFSLASIGMYVLSVLYGLLLSKDYSIMVYSNTFGKLVSGQWATLMILMFAVMLLAMYFWHSHLCQLTAKYRGRPWLQPHIAINSLIIIIIAVALVSLFQVYRLGFTNAFAEHPWLATRWQLSGAGLDAVERATILNWFFYSSPVLVIVGGFALLRTKVNLGLVLLLILPVTSLAVYVLGNPVLPYQYYYARYLLTESVPYFIIVLVVITVGSNLSSWRNAGYVAVILSAIWFSFFTVKQFGAEEGSRPQYVLNQVVSHLDKGDVLLIEPSGWNISRMAIETPLRFYFHLNTFVIPTEYRRENINKIAANYRKVYILSPKPIYDENFLLLERLKHYDKVTERSGHIPLKVVEGFNYQPLFLYEMRKKGWPSIQPQPFSYELDKYNFGEGFEDHGLILGAGWHSIEKNFVWSSGKAELVFNPENFAMDKLPDFAVIEIKPFVATSEYPAIVNVTTCAGYEEEHIYTSTDKFKLRIPLSHKTSQTACEIQLLTKTATSPKAIGLSGDSRQLGVALYSVTYK